MDESADCKLFLYANSVLLIFLCFQDIGYFLSPGERTYDAIGLMRQLNEHTAAVMAEAQEILASGNPESDAPQNSSGRNSQFQEKEPENLISSPPSALVCSFGHWYTGS